MTEDKPSDLFFENHGLKLHCLDWGSDRSRPLLLLHGPRDCARGWDIFAQAMRPDHHVVALDSRGHGDSGWAADARSAAASAMATLIA